VRRTAILALACAAAFCAVPSSALADSKIYVRDRILYFSNADAGIANHLTVDYDSRGRVHFVDDADPYGMNWGTAPCSPGRLNGSGNAVEVFCNKGSFDSIGILIGPNEDTITYSIPDMPSTLNGEVGSDKVTGGNAPDNAHGGQGNDTVDGGGGNDTIGGEEGDDTLSGGPGNDKIDGGPGSDTINGGDGDDTVTSADGTRDSIDCGAGTDTVTADTTDQVTNCETVTRNQVAPESGGCRGNPSVKPIVQAGGSTRQKVSLKRRRVSVAVSVTKCAQVDVSGYLVVAGVNEPLKPVAGNVKVGGGGITMRVVLTRGQAKQVMSDLRRHRRPRMRLTVTAADPAGNTSKPRHITIALAR
jgi:hypothetical protein